MANGFDFSNIGAIFGGGMGGTPSGLDALLSEDQRKLLGRNAAMSAAAALLQAGGRSTTPINLGQALGSALQAGQQGYQQARAGSLQDLLLGQKLTEAQRAAKADADFLRMLQPPEAAAAAPAPMQPLTGEAVPPIERFMSETVPAAPTAPAPMTTNALANLSPQQRALIGGLGREKGTQYLLEAMKPEATPENIKTLRALGLPVTLEGLRQLDKPEPSPAESRLLREAGVPVTLENIMQLRRSGATNLSVKVPVDMTSGQKGFENEMSLGKAFKSEPIYKDFSDMQAAFGQVVSSLSAGTPIGDVAGATKIMKLLDPGSVVRESELAIAMAASGRMDRLQNYFSNMMSGQKLTPTQRDDFKALANELYAAAGQAYNQKRGEYEGFGQAYGFKNLNTALGAPAKIPSLMRNAPGAGGGAAPSIGGGGTTRPSLGNIFGIPGG
jgi:hypothetical protein